MSLLAVAPSLNSPQQLLPSAGQVFPVDLHLPESTQVSTALQSHTSALNLTARDGPTANFTTHIPLSAGNYGSQLGTVLPCCVPNLA